MNSKFLIAAGLMCLSGAAVGATATEPNQKILTAALEKYLARHGDFCLGKPDWPIDVSMSDFQSHSRNALQMPVLEKLGLVAATDATAFREDGDAEKSVPVKRYTLTQAGKKYYVVQEGVGGKSARHGDFCAAKLRLDKLVRWSKPAVAGDHRETTLTYTYKISAAPWSHNPEIQRMFPVLAHILKGEGTIELDQRFRQVGSSWVAIAP